mmetsp:Transcript_128979/g.413122  ORF Transcript_128979/g.413122 Transcript_128979/m.413122 type:complete len:311 (+) Transcript_128979:695-1627(+)
MDGAGNQPWLWRWWCHFQPHLSGQRPQRERRWDLPRVVVVAFADLGSHLPLVPAGAVGIHPRPHDDDFLEVALDTSALVRWRVAEQVAGPQRREDCLVQRGVHPRPHLADVVVVGALSESHLGSEGAGVGHHPAAALPHEDQRGGRPGHRRAHQFGDLRLLQHRLQGTPEGESGHRCDRLDQCLGRATRRGAGVDSGLLGLQVCVSKDRCLPVGPGGGTGRAQSAALGRGRRTSGAAGRLAVAARMRGWRSRGGRRGRLGEAALGGGQVGVPLVGSSRRRRQRRGLQDWASGPGVEARRVACGCRRERLR